MRVEQLLMKDLSFDENENHLGGLFLNCDAGVGGGEDQGFAADKVVILLSLLYDVLPHFLSVCEWR